MAAPKGNQFWKLRSKHGRDKIFSEPGFLMEAIEEYLEACDSRKWIRKDWVGKDAVPVDRETDTPYLLSGLWVFLRITKTTWYEYKEREGFKEVITRAELIFTTQKTEGALVGAYNSNLVARIEGLKEQTDLTTNGKEISPVITAMVDGKVVNGELK